MCFIATEGHTDLSLDIVPFYTL